MKNLFRLLRYDWPLHFVLLFTNWLPDNVIFIRLRGRLAKPFFKRCGKKLGIGRNVVFYDSSKISFGDYVYIAYNCWFAGAEEIVVENEVLFGPGIIVTSTNHNRQNGSYRFGSGIDKPILIKKGTWIGGNSTITAGSVIGEGCVIGANTVVAGTVDDNSLYAGNPGKKIKTYE